MTQAQGIQTFDQSVAAGLGPDVALELPADQQYRGTLWPNPADNISNHSAEGAPWVPAAGTMNQPYDANKDTSGVNPLSYSVHDGYVLPFNAGVVRDARTGVEVRGPLNTGPHAADLIERSLPSEVGNTNYPLLDIPDYYDAKQGLHEQRHITESQWDPETGKRVNTPDQVSAPNDIFNAHVDTTPRQIGYQVPALLNWNWPSASTFPTTAEGNYGVSGHIPDMSQRPAGSVVAGQPDYPSVASPGYGAAMPAMDYYGGF